MATSSSHGTPHAERTSSLRVVTWNVGEIYWPWMGNQLKDRDVQVVNDALDELDADVVLLQELQHAGQLARLCGRRYAGHLPTCCGYDRHVAMLVRKTLGPRFTEHVLAPTKRGVVEASFRTGGIEARAFSLHLDVFRPARRLAQARSAAALIGAPGQLTIAGGDFNYDPIASARIGRELDDHTEAAFRPALRDLAADCGPTLVGLLRVDRLLGGGTAVAGARAHTARHRLPLGDHAPVVCDLVLRPTARRDIDEPIEGP